jgi:hypothetical protein
VQFIAYFDAEHVPSSFTQTLLRTATTDFRGPLPFIPKAKVKVLPRNPPVRPRKNVVEVEPTPKRLCLTQAQEASDVPPPSFVPMHAQQQQQPMFSFPSNFPMFVMTPNGAIQMSGNSFGTQMFQGSQNVQYPMQGGCQFMQPFMNK